MTESLSNSSIEANTLLPQKEGLRRLHSFLYEELAYDQLSAFMLDLSLKPEILQEHINFRYRFYMGSSGRRNRYLNLTVPLKTLASNNGTLWALPRSLNRGGKTYYWLEFYNLDNQEGGSIPFTSCRLHPNEQTHKINFERWHGVEEEVLADFILGENQITFEDLLPIDLFVKQKSILKMYRFGGKPELLIDLSENPSIIDGDSLLFLPRRDAQQLYTWLDVVRVTDEQPEAELTPVSSYRLLPEKRTLTHRGWPGAEKQVLLDFISGKEGISFDNLRSLYFTSQTWEAVNIGQVNGCQVAFYFPREALDPGEEGVLIPKQDEKGLYQWLELYKTDPKTNLPVGEVLASGRIIEGKINQKDWHGPEKQLLRDYLAGKVRFDQLEPLSVVSGKGKDLVHLWRDYDKRIYLVLSKSFNIHEGDTLIFLPEKETKDDTTFLLVKDNQILARYKLEAEQKRFTWFRSFIEERGKSQQELSLVQYITERFPNFSERLRPLAKLIEKTLDSSKISVTLDEKWTLIIILLWSFGYNASDLNMHSTLGIHTTILRSAFNMSGNDFWTRYRKVAEDERLAKAYDLLEKSVSSALKPEALSIISQTGPTQQ